MRNALLASRHDRHPCPRGLVAPLLALTTVALSRYSRTSPCAHLHAATEMLGDLADGRIMRSRFDPTTYPAGNAEGAPCA